MQPIDESPQTVSQVLHTLSQQDPHSPISVGHIMDALGYRGFGMLLVVFCAIPALPIPAQGIATVLAIPVLLIALQIIIGKRTPWLPKWITRKTIAGKTFITAIEKLTPYLHFFERFTKPRLLYMTTSIGERFIGIFAFIFAISMALPIPFSNTVPSAGIVVMALGLIERDGLAVKCGMILGSIGIFITYTIYTVGTEFLIELWQQFSS